MFLFFVGLIGFIVCVVILIIKAMRKKPKKAIGILTAVFLFFGLAGMIYAMSTPAVETVKADYKKIMAGEMNGQMVDLTGDIENIERDGDLYYITVKASDGIYKLATTKDVSGPFPQTGDKRVKMYVSPDYTVDGQLVIIVASFRK